VELGQEAKAAFSGKDEQVGDEPPEAGNTTKHEEREE
jgi:hypothetical protein